MPGNDHPVSIISPTVALMWVYYCAIDIWLGASFSRIKMVIYKTLTFCQNLKVYAILVENYATSLPSAEQYSSTVKVFQN